MKDIGPGLRHPAYRKRVLRTAPRLPTYVIKLLEPVFRQTARRVGGWRLNLLSDNWYLEKGAVYEHLGTNATHKEPA